MAQHGGPRTPAHPAHVSGPGQYSKRTDGHPAQVLSAAPDQEYGAMTQQMNDQRVAPMGAAAPLPPAAPVPAQAPPATHQMPTFNGTPLSAPTNRPNEPVTTGVPIGPGAGPEAMPQVAPPVGMGQATGAMSDMLAQIAPTDASGVVAALLQRAQTLGV